MHEQIINNIVAWIKDQAKKYNKDSVIIELENSTASVLLLYFCKKAQFKKITVLTTYEDENLVEFMFQNSTINIQYINMLKINNPLNSIFNNDSDIINDYDKIYYITYLTNFLNSVTISSITSNHYKFIRNYPKFHGFDLFPFADLKQSLIDQLFLTTADIRNNKIDSNIYETRIKLNEILPKYNITNEELEWLSDLNDKTIFNNQGIIESSDDPTRYPKWFMFTTRQKEIISKINQIEKITRHKINSNIEIFKNK